jgi:hypothetical protein
MQPPRNTPIQSQATAIEEIGCFSDQVTGEEGNFLGEADAATGMGIVEGGEGIRAPGASSLRSLLP